MRLGALWLIGGLVITAATYSAANDGVAYVVTFGAIAVGAAQFIGGPIQYSKAKPA